MKVKTAVKVAFFSIIVISILVFYLADIKRWQTIGWKTIINHPILTLIVMSPVIVGLILGFLFTPKFIKKYEIKLKEKYGIDENVEMDKKRFMKMIVFMVIPAIIVVLWIVLFRQS